MKKVYVFGAGVNAYGVIKFWKKENVISVVDSDDKREGILISGVPVITLSRFFRQYAGETVIVTPLMKSEEITAMLQKNNINNIYRAPFIQGGFYSDTEEIIRIHKLDKYENLTFFDKDLLSECIEEKLNKYSSEDKTNSETAVVLCRDRSEYSDREWEEINSYDRVIFLLDIERLEQFRHKELENFRNIHTNRRCFIIGNGPSLKAEDLDILYEQGEICFGVNKISNIFEKTKWRPSYYVMSDYYEYIMDYDDLLEMMRSTNITYFIRDFYCKKDFPPLQNMYLFRLKTEKLRPNQKPDFSTDITRCLYAGFTVSYSCIQLAAYMGFKEIYLLGMDCSCKGAAGQAGNHFYYDNREELIEGRSVSADVERWFKAYEKAREISCRNNFKIYNATRGGNLEIFERVDFDKLF